MLGVRTVCSGPSVKIDRVNTPMTAIVTKALHSARFKRADNGPSANLCDLCSLCRCDVRAHCAHSVHAQVKIT